MLTIAAVSLLMVGCATTTDTTVDGTSSSSMDSMTMSSEAMASSADVVMSYEDGTYAADGNYISPAGEEEVGVSLTLADGVVTDATFQGKAEHPASKQWQGKFSEGFKELVVGKSIDEISLGVVNGSSLAPKGFMDAVEKIKVEAQAS